MGRFCSMHIHERTVEEISEFLVEKKAHLNEVDPRTLEGRRLARNVTLAKEALRKKGVDPDQVLKEVTGAQR